MQRPRRIKRVAQAKVNLCLHVTGQRHDGYHVLDSIVAFAEAGDILTFEPAENVSLSIDGPFGARLAGNSDNLILRAAHLFDCEQGAAIHLEKNLPVSSGIGGGSADAAATLNGLAALWQRKVPDVDVQLSLGADVPVCVVGRPARMRGIGDFIEPLVHWTVLPVVLVNPGVEVSTPAVFGGLPKKENGPLGLIPRDDVVNWLKAQRNDLQKVAIAAVPEIGLTLESLDNHGAQLARMSGSGATCFGIFGSDEAAAEAGAAISEQHPEWWVQTTRLTT